MNNNNKQTVNGKSSGFYDDKGKWYLIRCFSCVDDSYGRENWIPAVTSGQCAWCGYTPDKKVEDETIKES